MPDYDTSEMDEDNYFNILRQAIKQGQKPPVIKYNRSTKDSRQSFINYIRN